MLITFLCLQWTCNKNKISYHKKYKPDIKGNAYYKIILFLSNLITTKTKRTKTIPCHDLFPFSLGLKNWTINFNTVTSCLACNGLFLRAIFLRLFPANHFSYKTIVLSQSSISFTFIIPYYWIQFRCILCHCFHHDILRLIVI